MKETSEKVRILVAFGDISGFTTFLDSVTNDEIEYDPFMAEYDAIISRTARETRYTFDETGDGFMCTVDLRDGDNSKTAVQVILTLWKLLKEIEKLIENKHPPRPSGFRIVAASGYVKRLKNYKGETVDRGKHINWAHKYLDRSRGKGLVILDSVKQLISSKDAKRNGFKFAPLDERAWILKMGR